MGTGIKNLGFRTEGLGFREVVKEAGKGGRQSEVRDLGD